MKTLILYRPNSEHRRTCEDFIHEFSRRYPDRHLETQHVDSPAGQDLARIYDITSYPAILVMTNDGVLQTHWQGLPLPLLNEVYSYAKS